MNAPASNQRQQDRRDEKSGRRTEKRLRHEKKKQAARQTRDKRLAEAFAAYRDEVRRIWTWWNNQ